MTHNRVEGRQDGNEGVVGRVVREAAQGRGIGKRRQWKWRLHGKQQVEERVAEGQQQEGVLGS